MLSEPTAKRLLIDGQWVEAASGRTFESRDPATGELVGVLAEGDAIDIDRAVAAARCALKGPWRGFTPADRSAVLLRLAALIEDRADEFALIDTLDMGAPIGNTRWSVGFMISVLRFNAAAALGIEGRTKQPSMPGMFAATVKEPVGVCGGITPWNSPLWGAVLNVGPVLASGCTLVLKPAEDACLSPLLLGELCLEAGVPPGVINIVTGFGPIAGAALAAHLDVDKLSFTGSTVTGRSIVRASAGNLKRLSLELGGKSPNIVFADADIEAAAPAAAMAAFMNSGQICSAGTRLFVERGIADEFAAEVARIGAAMRIGIGRDPGTELGPLVSARQLARVVDHIDGARAEGATVVSGGARMTGSPWDAGFFVPPTVLTGLKDAMTVVREEVFGPVLSVLPFDTIEEVEARANATPYGLGAGVWTKDIGKAHRLGRALRAGSVWVNCYNALDAAVPAGGYKGSGYGREFGHEHLEEYLQTKALWINAA